jgi:thiol-disulfide isomerase/thioredoxin
LLNSRIGWVVALLMAALLAQASGRLPQIDGNGFKRELAKRKGKVVVVNLWATWCQPCREEFPALVKLHDNYRTRGVEVIVISVDSITAEPQVAEFLRQQRASMPAFIKKPGDSEKFINAIDRDWRGAIPYTVVYDHNGKPFAKLLGDHSYAQFEEKVKQALAKRK